MQHPTIAKMQLSRHSQRDVCRVLCRALSIVTVLSVVEVIVKALGEYI